ncbi:Uncharacterized protein PECH_003417 [Penicillium ucsense]|uniref:Uncharacterized protein n=1 Tax=Penicillium ucsense TaxID=2839758 RepID=A0A8J8WBE7_9EURO|nr:Uncharacterized protein PECM_000227 [Penicillium ucsense]KAF7739438.1 Uncharacterized protein PECH_003417 [Penicillium ucsense]
MQKLYARDYTFWYYTPSLAAAVIFLLAYIVLTGLHSMKMFKGKKWFCIPFTCGGIFEIIGYIGRVMAHNDITSMGPYILQSIFILLAPSLFAASVYMVLGRLIRYVGGEHLSVIRVSRLTKTFVWCDVLSFLIQASSSSLSVMGYDTAAKIAVVTGLIIQLLSFGAFWVSAVVFSRRIRRSPTPKSLLPSNTWKTSMNMLYAVSTLIIIRSIFRIFEYVLGNNGYPLQHEWTSYIFDAVLMVAVMIIYLVWYPSHISVTGGPEDSLPLAHVYSNL